MFPLLGVTLVALAGCPLPQPLPDVARTPDGGSVSTPIILADTAVPAGAIVYVLRDCPNGAAQIPLTFTVEDLDTSEAVEVRWFLNYQRATPGLLDKYTVPAAADPSDPRRLVPPYPFTPYVTSQIPLRPLDIVDAVVSNGFLPTSDPTDPFQRAAPAPYVTQSYRWVFQYVDAPDPRALPCP